MRIAAEALPFVGAAAALAALVALWWPWAALAPVAALLFVLFFFRDPRRTPPADLDGIVSPADGRVLVAGPHRVSVFLSLFDVHVCRTPVAGVVREVEHVPGDFLAAFKEAASERNERTSIVVEGGRTPVKFTLVAGLVARRIVCKVSAGQLLAAGDRVGLIRFGSRVDVDLPPGARPAVSPGERVVAGETVIARYFQSTAPEGQ